MAIPCSTYRTPRTGRAGTSLSSREEPGAHPQQPPTIREALPCDCSTAGRLQSAGRRGRAPGHAARAARAGGVPSHPRGPREACGAPSTARSPARPGADPPAGRRRHKKRGGAASAQGGGAQPAPTPVRIPARLTDPCPGSQQRRAHPSPARSRAKSPPAPASLGRCHHPAEPQRTHRPRRSRGSSFPSRAAALYRGAGGANGRQSGPGQQQLTGGAHAALPSLPLTAAVGPAPRGVRMEGRAESRS